MGQRWPIGQRESRRTKMLRNAKGTVAMVARRSLDATNGSRCADNDSWLLRKFTATRSRDSCGKQQFWFATESSVCMVSGNSRYVCRSTCKKFTKLILLFLSFRRWRNDKNICMCTAINWPICCHSIGWRRKQSQFVWSWSLLKWRYVCELRKRICHFTMCAVVAEITE